MSQPISRAAETVGRRIRQQRQLLAVTQETLAELSGVHWTFIGQVERGSRNLSLHNIIKIASGLGVDPAMLVAGLNINDVPASGADKESDAERILRERREASES